MQTINRTTEKNFYRRDIEQFINMEKHPCIIGSSLIEQENYDFDIFEQFGDRESSELMCEGIYRFLKEASKSKGKGFRSYMAIFRTPGYMSEIDFEETLWQHLKLAHEYDSKKYEWDPQVSRDPKDAKFSFSIGGHAFYVIGLHPMSSRKARRFQHVALVFNLHSQFEELRNAQIYSKVKERVRVRDKEMNGSINPMLKDFGTHSEAIQYSGRKVSDEWKCPFHGSKV